MMGYALLVTDRRLLPAWSGNRLRILGVIRALRALGWKVVLVGANLGPLEQLKPLVDGLFAVRARSFPGGDLATFDARPFRRAVDRAAAEVRPAVAIAEYAWLAPALRTLPRGVRRWVDCHDVLHERTARFRAAGLDPWTICTREQEAGLLNCADVLITCQERDAQVLQTLLPRKRTVCMLTQIDLPEGFGPVPAHGNMVLAVGAHHAGNEGICEFASEAWPRVIARVPQARLKIVGGIGALLPDLPGIDVVGQVDDLHRHYESAAVVVCPVTVGSGVKTKMLEALRLGKAVVVTPAAEEGLPISERRAWVTADSLPACADAVAALLEDGTGRAQLEERAFAFGEKHLSAESFQDQIRPLLPNRVSLYIARLLGRGPRLGPDSHAATLPATEAACCWLPPQRLGPPLPGRVMRAPEKLPSENDDNRGFRISALPELEPAVGKDSMVPTIPRRVSVVVPHAGKIGQLRTCLHSLLHQSYARAILEIIVVENFERDIRAELVREFPSVTVTREAKPGAAAARNYGAALAQGDIIAFLDSDCRPARDWLENAVEVSLQHGEECIVACNLKPGKRQSGVAGVQWYEAIAFRKWKAYGDQALQCSTRGVIVPRHVWHAIGPFDEDFLEAGCEDREWLARASSRKIGIVRAPDAIVVHPVHGTWHGLRAKTRRLARGELRLLKKCGGKDPQRFRPLVSAHTKRLKRDLATAIREERIPLRFRLDVAVAAACVWYWSLTETRKQLRACRVTETSRPEPSCEPKPSANLPLGSVSIIVPCAGWPDTLPACLTSLQAQVIDVPIEIVVVINGPDASAANRRWPGVTIVHEPRQGPAAARNTGVRAAMGDVLALIDSDCIATPQWIAAALRTMSNGAAGKIVAGAISRSGATRSWVSLYDSLNFLQQERYVKYSGACVTANLLVHRSVFEQIGPFDEAFEEAAFEDWEWVLRARRTGIPIVYDAEALVDHPCMSKLAEIKKKAERLARGGMLLNSKIGHTGTVPDLIATLRGQARRAYRNDRVSFADRMRLMCVGIAVGFWTWKAARLWQREG